MQKNNLGQKHPVENKQPEIPIPPKPTQGVDFRQFLTYSLKRKHHQVDDIFVTGETFLKPS
ncbi:hypothetical protein Plim_2778 [Planctopirus limnophila DSM 3776]|uniref:Uncharacterized protein n=1 Tax=Planctopirus limnophila (strain ATCC 43296 / DSM 3776 / IFAM 1008 / Mu 290) TaxID=521674 RepID=D5SRA8_PLAL2|nr:hypothetical protein Plim_2778 [Planctopirus limnophila DSM 3776]